MTSDYNLIVNDTFDNKIKEYYYHSYETDVSEDIEQLYCSIISRELYNDTNKTIIKNILIQINKQINELLIKYDCNPNILHLKEDIDLIIVFEKIVIKIFNVKKNKNIIELYNKIINIKSDYLEHIYETILVDEIYLLFVVSKKIVSPINKINIISNTNKINSNIYNALIDLTNNNILHNDVSIDNIGFDTEIDKYILFDFAGSKIISLDNDNLEIRKNNIFNNLNKLNKSINFNIMI